jgi:hypothetical protein
MLYFVYRVDWQGAGIKNKLQMPKKEEKADETNH